MAQCTPAGTLTTGQTRCRVQRGGDRPVARPLPAALCRRERARPCNARIPARRPVRSRRARGARCFSGAPGRARRCSSTSTAATGAGFQGRFDFVADVRRCRRRRRRPKLLARAGRDAGRDRPSDARGAAVGARERHVVQRGPATDHRAAATRPAGSSPASSRRRTGPSAASPTTSSKRLRDQRALRSRAGAPLEVNDWLRLDEAAAARNSPFVASTTYGGELMAIAGGNETSEFRRQTIDYAAKWQAAGMTGRSAHHPGTSTTTTSCSNCWIPERVASAMVGTALSA